VLPTKSNTSINLMIMLLPGCDVPNESYMPLEQALNDQFRVDFYSGYIASMAQAMVDGGT
jgi:hypothetical protein